jgi:hypothetical protein
MRHAWTSTIAALTTLLVGARAGAQPAESPPRPGYGCGGGRSFDPGALEMIEGEILEVTSAPSPGWHPARVVHLSVQTSDSPVAVHLGPQWHLQRKGRVGPGCRRADAPPAAP